MSLTRFGIAVRKLRLDKNMTLTQMADAMEVSGAYVSSVEFGKKPITNTFLNSAMVALEVTDFEAIDLHKAADLTREEHQIDLSNASDEARMVAGQFARRINEIAPDELEKLKQLLKD